MDITLETPAIETTAKPSTPTLRYPVLMQAVGNKHIVLFSSETEGTVLYGGEEHLTVGHHLTSWKPATASNTWALFTGTLPLRNIILS